MIVRLLLLATLLAGCADDVDLGGMYVVDSHVASEPCGNDQPVLDGPAYLRFTRGDLFGSPYFSYADCTDEAGTDCTSTGGLFGGFYEPIDDGWRGRLSSSSGGAGSCLLSFTEQTATLGGNQLVIESSTHVDVAGDLSDEACSPEEAERRGTAMPCTEHERIEGTKL